MALVPNTDPPLLLDDGVEVVLTEDDAKYLLDASMVFLCAECAADGSDNVYHPTLDHTYKSCEEALKKR